MSDPDPRAALARFAAARGDSLAALSAMLGRNAAYLQQYVKRGSPRRLAEDDRRLLAQYLGVEDHVLGGSGGKAGQSRTGFQIARLAVQASAGPGALVDDEVLLGTDVIDPALARRLGLRDGQAAIIRVRGTSMEPGLQDGDHIIVNMATTVPGARGRLHVIRVDGLTMVKRVALRDGTLSVSSDNPAAPPVPDGPVDIVGRVVWQMREPS